jgi:hypothetical protein
MARTAMYPGEHLAEELKALGMSAAALSRGRDGDLPDRARDQSGRMLQVGVHYRDVRRGARQDTFNAGGRKPAGGQPAEPCALGDLDRQVGRPPQAYHSGSRDRQRSPPSRCLAPSVHSAS